MKKPQQKTGFQQETTIFNCILILSLKQAMGNNCVVSVRYVAKIWQCTSGGTRTFVWITGKRAGESLDRTNMEKDRMQTSPQTRLGKRD